MPSSDKYTEETILDIKVWTDNLFTFKTTRYSGYRFIPGQFARLGVTKPDSKVVWRPYSIVSANYDESLEFYSIVVPDGEFTSELSKLKIGDKLFVDKTNYGFLTTDRFENGKDLWMLSTGTGLAPFISILYDFSTWEQYENIILVHSVRHVEELAYQELIEGFKTHEFFSEFGHKLKYVKTVTREKVAGTLNARVTTLIENGGLEAELGLPLDLDRSRVMICGNPEMVDQTRVLLQNKGMTVSRRGQPGHLAVENYW
jgi:ferredoxin/flavodoxin---NADP+ reductase